MCCRKRCLVRGVFSAPCAALSAVSCAGVLEGDNHHFGCFRAIGVSEVDVLLALEKAAVMFVPSLVAIPVPCWCQLALG